MSPSVTIALTLFAAAVAFLLSGMEAGVFGVSRFRIRRLARHGNRRAARLQRFLDHPENFLWTILVGNTLAIFTIVTVASIHLRSWLGNRLAAFLVSIFTVLVLLYLFADLLPKLLFRRFPNRLTLLGVPPFRILHLALAPAVAATEGVSRRLLRLTGGRAFTGRLFGSRAELRHAIEDSAQSLSREEVVMINRILDLQNQRVRDVMTPLSRAITLPASGTVTDLLALVRERRVSYVPLWKETDRGRRILGVVALSNVLYDLDPATDPRRPLESLVQPAIFVEEDARLDVALLAMQRGRQRLALVLGPGRVESGVVTLNDILRAMFGEVNV